MGSPGFVACCLPGIVFLLDWSLAQLSLGTELSLSVGPVGRTASTDIRAGDGGVTAAFSYAHSKVWTVTAAAAAAVTATACTVAPVRKRTAVEMQITLPLTPSELCLDQNQAVFFGGGTLVDHTKRRC